MIYLAADHAGFQVKEYICHKLSERQLPFEDFGTFSEEPVDYPGFAKRVAKEVARGRGVGVLACDSGEGMAIAANRYKNVRASVVWSEEVAIETREDNDANIVVLPARFISREKAWDIVSSFLSTTFSHESRHKRRIHQIDEKL